MTAMSFRPTKRRRLDPSAELRGHIAPPDLFRHAAEWNLEQSYERLPRLKKTKESTRLPIKTAQGLVEAQRTEDGSNSGSDCFGGVGSESEQDGLGAPLAEETSELLQVPLRQRILATQEELAKIAEIMSEDPEAHVGSFKKLAAIGNSDAHPAIKKLNLATQLAVYKDLIPGYRIRNYSEEEMRAKASKEVRQTRQYEQALVTGYQRYVGELASCLKSQENLENTTSLKQVALNCVCSLLLAVPHFNFRTELLKILVNQVSGRHQTPYSLKSVRTLEKFYDADTDGAPSLEAVTMVAKMMKAKDYRVHEDILNTFFYLRLLSELPGKDAFSHPRSAGNNLKSRDKKLKGKLEPRSKRERKIARERKVVEKDMKEADAIVSVEERDKKQSQTLQAVFAVYFRILKLGVPHLTGTVLEGLAKFAHLINQDFFGDLLEALKELVQHVDTSTSELTELEDVGEDQGAQLRRSRVRESLLATQTAFTLLSRQEVQKSASALQLDLSFFTSHIYKQLYAMSLDSELEPSPKSLRILDPGSSAGNKSLRDKTPRINVSTPTLLLARVLTSMLLTPAAPAPTITAISFYKRLLTISLQLPEKSVMVLQSVILRVLQKHGRKVEPLWYSDERKGDGTFQGGSETIQGTNVLAPGSGVWEMEILRHHFSPRVRGWVVESEKQVLRLQS